VKYNKRITHIHVKDVSAEVLAKLENKEILSMEDAVSNYKLFVPAGTGMLELDNLCHELKKINYSGWLMSEQDSAWEPAEAASGVSYAAIKKAISGAM
jgi:sugar phosphate isomerase/epimerase